MARLGDDGSDVCSYCGGEMRPVVYGLPSPELFEEADKGDVILGGCCIPSSPAQTRCIDCGHEARATSSVRTCGDGDGGGLAAPPRANAITYASGRR